MANFKIQKNKEINFPWEAHNQNSQTIYSKQLINARSSNTNKKIEGLINCLQTLYISSNPLYILHGGSNIIYIYIYNHTSHAEVCMQPCRTLMKLRRRRRWWWIKKKKKKYLRKHAYQTEEEDSCMQALELRWVSIPIIATRRIRIKNKNQGHNSD